MSSSNVPKDILPTLIIGLGGTGYQVIKRLKQLFKKRYNTDKLPIRYLLIDTDLKTFLDDDIKNNEKCQLRFGEGIKNTLKWAYENPNFDWLPQNPKITPDFFTSTDQGAGLVRPIGRLYFCKNAKLAYDNLQTAKNDLVDLHKVLTELGDMYLENIDRHKVYIVGSLAGGTGCGIFLDVAVMVSKIFNRDNTNIIGMFTLESCYDDKLSSDLDAQNRSKANCYAALKELEFYMSSITNPEDPKYTFKYSNVGEIKLDRKLLDICYLVENKNELGGVLTNIEDIYDLCSLQLFQEVGTTLGSQLRADYANFICKDKDPILKKDRHFSTFSSSSMEFSSENLRNYCSYMLAKDMLVKLSNKYNNNEEDINNELKGIIKEINTLLKVDELCEDFTSTLMLPSPVKYKKLSGELIRNLATAEELELDKENQWGHIKNKCEEDLEKILVSHVNKAVVNHGIKFAIQVLDRLDSAFSKESKKYTVGEIIDRNTVEESISRLKNKKDPNYNSKIISEKNNIPNDIENSFNNFIEQQQNKINKIIFKDRYDLLARNIKALKDSLDELTNKIIYTISQVENNLNKINIQSEKRYGGNIISREIVSKDFYIKYYNDKKDILHSSFKDINLLEIIKDNTEELTRLCYEQCSNMIKDINIIEVLRLEAERNGKDAIDEIKRELNVTSKLAKPFWSAVKNPEVAWTECYYIGCIKDKGVSNGFTIKAPEEIDNWVRNQTGERSRWARYVETSNPDAIDVIHITMGACAAYLPDIKNYKQFYLRLLTSETYPLHLHQNYIGLDELDEDIGEMLLDFTLAKVYGAIIDIDGATFLNIKVNSEDEYTYIYKSKYNLNDDGYKANELEMPQSKASVDKYVRKLGDSYHESIRCINEDAKISSIIKGFIKDTEIKFKNKALKLHYEKLYLEDRLSDKASVGFIEKQKLNHMVAAN